MFGLNPLAPHRPGGREAGIDPTDERLGIGLAAFGVMVDQAARCVDAGILHGDPPRLALQLWATSHGVLCLELAGFLGDDGEAVYESPPPPCSPASAAPDPRAEPRSSLG